MALILIVDDSPTEVYQMQRALESHGFQTAVAADGAEGIRLAHEMHPDLILMLSLIHISEPTRPY